MFAFYVFNEANVHGFTLTTTDWFTEILAIKAY